MIKKAEYSKKNKNIEIYFKSKDKNKEKDRFYDILKIVKSIPGRYFRSENKRWFAPIDLETINMLDENGFALCKKLKKYQSKFSAKQNKDLNEVDNKLSNLEKEIGRKLYQFQKDGIKFLIANQRSGLIGDDPGLGKTAQALSFLAINPDLRPAIIVCPANMKYGWLAESKKWLPKNQQNIFLIEGRPGLNAKENILRELSKHKKTYNTEIDTNAPIIIINYDILANTKSFLKDYDKKWDFYCKNKKFTIPYSGWGDLLPLIKPKCIILDECHYIKNGARKRSKATLKLAKNRNIESIISISATPILSRPAELFNILNLHAPNIFSNRYRFLHRFCDPKHNGFGWSYNGASNLKELNELLTNIMIRRKKKDVLKELPDKIRTVVPLEIDNRKIYENAESNLIAWIAENEGAEKAIKAIKAESLVKISKLKEIALEGKMKSAISWIENFLESDEKLCIFTTHKLPIKKITEYFKKKNGIDFVSYIDGGIAPKKRQEIVDRFQKDPTNKLFIGNMTAAGVGYTLTAASNLIIFEPPWTPGELDQVEDRIHRITQNNCVGIWYLLAANTIEIDIIEILDQKRIVLENILDNKESENKLKALYDRSILDEIQAKFKNKN